MVERRRAGVLDRAEEQIGCWFEGPARERQPVAQALGDGDELGTIHVEDAARLGLVTCGHVIARQARDVDDAVQGGAEDVGLQREAVLVAADDLQHRLDAEPLERDRDRDVGRVRVRRRVVGRVDRIHVLAQRLHVAAHLVEAAAVDHGELRRDDRPRAVLAQRPEERAHACGPPLQPAGFCRSRPLSRFFHDDVPSRRLSSGARRWFGPSRQLAGISGIDWRARWP